ncbi:hypothetical protein Nepgr_024714 [Nepenthes gracilis]|uniref:Uncharacterized protein n=1 Tax=Nepenthes gracilis TaxID=150966 RepID=A0AAD3T594_NEPGR|nr:hypothetical protein Nepgr_024714 [Nepenthes gracilis]
MWKSSVVEYDVRLGSKLSICIWGIECVLLVGYPLDQDDGTVTEHREKTLKSGPDSGSKEKSNSLSTKNVHVVELGESTHSLADIFYFNWKFQIKCMVLNPIDHLIMDRRKGYLEELLQVVFEFFILSSDE